MEEIFNEIRNGLDIPYMLVVNAVNVGAFKYISATNSLEALDVSDPL